LFFQPIDAFHRYKCPATLFYKRSTRSLPLYNAHRVLWKRFLIKSLTTTRLTRFGIQCNQWCHCNEYQTIHMQLNKPYKNLLLENINPIKIHCLKKQGNQKNNKKARASNTEGNYETLFLFLECIENNLNQIEKDWDDQYNEITYLKFLLCRFVCGLWWSLPNLYFQKHQPTPKSLLENLSCTNIASKFC